MGDEAQVNEEELIMKRNEQTRQEVAADINALEEKLNVKKQVTHAREEMVGTVMEKKDEIVHKVKDKIPGMGSSSSNGGSSPVGVGTVASLAVQNPLAALAFAYGAKTLFSSWQDRRSQNLRTRSTYNFQPGYPVESSARYPMEENDSPGLKDRVSGVGSSITDKAGSAGSAITGKASNAGSAVAGRASDLKQGVGQKLPSDSEELRRTVRENLPAAGIAAMAFGAMAGLAAPRTNMENEYVGQVREQLVEKGSELVDKGQELAGQAKTAVTEGVSAGVDAAKETTKDEMSSGSSSTEKPYATSGSTLGTGSTI